ATGSVGEGSSKQFRRAHRAGGPSQNRSSNRGKEPEFGPPFRKPTGSKEHGDVTTRAAASADSSRQRCLCARRSDTDDGAGPDGGGTGHGRNPGGGPGAE